LVVEQVEHERTVASQVVALEEAAGTMGVTVAEAHRYIDDGVSGSRLDRPGLDALRDAAADGLLDVVLVYAPDRLARNYVHQHVLIEELEKHGVAVQFVERPIGDRAEDRLLVQMQGVIAGWIVADGWKAQASRSYKSMRSVRATDAPAHPLACTRGPAPLRRTGAAFAVARAPRRAAEG
jgi:hypothetical protein